MKPPFHDRPALRDQRGFTIIEIMVSSALLAVTLGLLSFQYVRQEQTRAQLQLQQAGRQLLGDLLTSIATNGDAFPPLTLGGNLVTYVGCFNDIGTVRTTVNGVAGFEDSFDAFTIRTAQTSICAPNIGGMEAHIRRDASDDTVVIVHVIILKNLATGAGRQYGSNEEVHYENLVSTRRKRALTYSGPLPDPSTVPTIPPLVGAN